MVLEARKPRNMAPSAGFLAGYGGGGDLVRQEVC